MSFSDPLSLANTNAVLHSPIPLVRPYLFRLEECGEATGRHRAVQALGFECSQRSGSGASGEKASAEIS